MKTIFILFFNIEQKDSYTHYLTRKNRLNEKLVAKYMREIISAVEYLHYLDPPIIHRDIKPENILLDSNDSVKL